MQKAVSIWSQPATVLVGEGHRRTCHFGSHDFYPFVTGELKQAESEIFALLADR